MQVLGDRAHDQRQVVHGGAFQQPVVLLPRTPRHINRVVVAFHIFCDALQPVLLVAAEDEDLGADRLGTSLTLRVTVAPPLQRQENPHTLPLRCFSPRFSHSGEASSNLRTIRAPMTHTAASIFLLDPRDSLLTEIPHRFGDLRAFTTCRPTLESPSWVNECSSISCGASSAAIVKSYTLVRMSHATGCGSFPPGTAHTISWSPYRFGHSTFVNDFPLFYVSEKPADRPAVKHGFHRRVDLEDRHHRLGVPRFGSHTSMQNTYPVSTWQAISAVASFVLEPSKNATMSSPSARTCDGSAMAAHCCGVTHASTEAVGWFR